MSISMETVLWKDKVHVIPSVLKQCSNFTELTIFLSTRPFHKHDAPHLSDAERGRYRTQYFDYICLSGGKLSDMLAHFRAYAKLHGYRAFKSESYARGHIRYREESMGWKYRWTKDGKSVTLIGVSK